MWYLVGVVVLVFVFGIFLDCCGVVWYGVLEFGFGVGVELGVVCVGGGWYGWVDFGDVGMGYFWLYWLCVVIVGSDVLGFCFV